MYKNDYLHTKKQYKKKEETLTIQSISQEKFQYIFHLDKEQVITKIQIAYTSSCKQKPNGTVFLQRNNEWTVLPESLGEQYFTLPYFDMGGVKNNLIYYIPYEESNTVKIVLSQESNSCQVLFSNPIIKGIKSS